MNVKKLYHNAPVFSQLFLVVSLMCVVLNYFGHHVVYSLFALNPTTVLQHGEWWRVLSYPLAGEHPLSFLLLIVSVGIFASALEISFSTRRFAVMIAAVVLAQGLSYTALCSSIPSAPWLSGGDVIAFFVMAMFVFIQPSRNIVLWKNVEIRGLHLALILSGQALVYKVYGVVHDGSEQLYYGVLPSLFGVVSAIMITTFVQQRLRRVRRVQFGHAAERLDQRIIEEEEELVSSLGSSDRALSKMYYPDPPRSEEEMMNILLDKIFEHGQDSLTQEEKQFLEEYSQRMR